MNNRPIATLILIFTALVVTLGTPIFDTSLYGHNGHPTEWLSFMPEAPFRAYGLTLIFSPFIHLGLQHLLTNFILLVPVAMMIERKKSPSFLLSLFFVLHFTILSLLVLFHQLKPISGLAFLGMSHVIIALITYWALITRRYGMLMFAVFILAMGWWQAQSAMTLLAHTLGLLMGACLFALGRSWQKLRP